MVTFAQKKLPIPVERDVRYVEAEAVGERLDELGVNPPNPAKDSAEQEEKHLMHAVVLLRPGGQKRTVAEDLGGGCPRQREHLCDDSFDQLLEEVLRAIEHRDVPG